MSSTGEWDTYFKGRYWRVAEEVSGSTRMQRGIEVTFVRGVFSVKPPGGFRSPLSTNLGRHGVLLQETDATGATDIVGSRAVFGAAAVKKARETYGTVW